MIVYFAHPIPMSSESKGRIIHSLMRRFGYVIDPESPGHDEGYNKLGMSYFLDHIIPQANVIAGLCYPDLCWGAGVWKEMQHAKKLGLDTFRVDYLGDISPCDVVIREPFRLLTIEETRERRKKYPCL